MKVGVLCLQGAFEEHIKILDTLGAKTFEIRQKSNLQNSLDALIIPGGESTVIGSLLVELDLIEPIKDMITKGLPTFGTCAGLILMAREIYEDDKKHLGVMDIVAKRNAYGRQLGSFNTIGEFDKKKIPMTFIRAPYIYSAGSEVEILSRVDDKIVAVKQKNMLATAFHPELTDNDFVHKYFMNMAKNTV